MQVAVALIFLAESISYFGTVLQYDANTISSDKVITFSSVNIH